MKDVIKCCDDCRAENDTVRTEEAQRKIVCVRQLIFFDEDTVRT